MTSAALVTVHGHTEICVCISQHCHAPLQAIVGTAGFNQAACPAMQCRALLVNGKVTTRQFTAKTAQHWSGSKCSLRKIGTAALPERGHASAMKSVITQIKITV